MSVTINNDPDSDQKLVTFTFDNLIQADPNSEDFGKHVKVVTTIVDNPDVILAHYERIQDMAKESAQRLRDVLDFVG